MAQGVFVITEQRDGAFRKVSFEAVSEGRRIADGLGAGLTAVVLGSGVEGMAAELEKYGPDKILVADDPALADYTTSAYTNIIADLVKSVDPAVIILGASAQARICPPGWPPGWMPAWPWIVPPSNWKAAI